MKSIISRITGIDKVKDELERELETIRALAEYARAEADQAEKDIEVAKQLAETAKIEAENALKEKDAAVNSEKDKATSRGEPWVSVIQTNINQHDPRNGFFELDWNHKFIENLIHHGYGYEDDPEEEIVDRWFRDLAGNLLAEHNLPTNVMGGYINVSSISKEHTEVS
jgi:hypothetical protein